MDPVPERPAAVGADVAANGGEQRSCYAAAPVVGVRGQLGVPGIQALVEHGTAKQPLALDDGEAGVRHLPVALQREQGVLLERGVPVGRTAGPVEPWQTWHCGDGVLGRFVDLDHPACPGVHRAVPTRAGTSACPLSRSSRTGRGQGRRGGNVRRGATGGAEAGAVMPGVRRW